MILWLSPLMRKKLDVRCLRRKAAANFYSHDNYFHSVLRLLNIVTLVYKQQLDIFEGCTAVDDILEQPLNIPAYLTSNPEAE